MLPVSLPAFFLPDRKLGGCFMKFTRWPALTALAALFCSGGLLFAGDLYDKGPAKTDQTVLPKPPEVQALVCYPAKITLKGGDDAAQLLITANLAGGKLQDLSSDVTYEVADPKLITVTSSGRILPKANGLTEITAKYGDKTVKVAVATEHCDENLPINFGNQIVPIFTKLGCNSGGCHGKASGQNGFKLSLLGFEPEVDYNALVKEGRGRRLLPAAPDYSLLLLKASGKMAHGGGKKIEADSDEYKLIRRWIAAGMPFGKPTDPVVTKISIVPDQRVLTRNNHQQFAVYAHYSDNSVEDITRRAQYDSNDTEIAVVDPSGLVRTLALSGEAGIMARYQGKVAVFRATVPLGVAIPEYKFEPQTLVDQFTHKKWQELGLVPSDLCSDADFVRRVSSDLTGTLRTRRMKAAAEQR